MRRETQKADELDKRRSVQKASVELQAREDDCRQLHIKDQKEKEKIAKNRKYEKEKNAKIKILETNR